MKRAKLFGAYLLLCLLAVAAFADETVTLQTSTCHSDAFSANLSGFWNHNTRCSQGLNEYAHDYVTTHYYAVGCGIPYQRTIWEEYDGGRLCDCTRTTTWLTTVTLDSSTCQPTEQAVWAASHVDCIPT
jgi:hypothetical protein